MGGLQSAEGTDFLIDSYSLLKEENGLKILEDKKTQQTFALKEQCFVNRGEYDRMFKRMTNSDNANNCENILQLIKLWSKEHNGICSNLFKIYSVYEYPRVKLIDEIEARKTQKKYFQQIQLMSILQSCLNALKVQTSLVNISPSLIFILPQGALKLIHADLVDCNCRTVYNPDYYYSPEKMEKFNSQTLDSPLSIQKQIVFSLGMTLLHSALLQNPSCCYQISLKRFNKKRLQFLQSQLQNIYNQTLVQIVHGMTQLNPNKRLTFSDLQTLANQYFSANSQSIISSFSEQQKINQNIKPTTNQINSRSDDISLIYSGADTFHPANHFSSSNTTMYLPLNSNDKLIKKGQFQHLFDFAKQPDQNQPANNQFLNKNKHIKAKADNPQINKQNIYTDSKLLQMIKSGVDQINKSTKERELLKQSNQNQIILKQVLPNNSSKDLFSDYQLISGSKSRCTFVVQTYEDNSKFQGMIMDNLKNGFGRLTYSDGVYYQGNFKNDSLHGKGSLFYGPNRPAYIGQWINNKFHGKGTLYNEYSSPLQGSFDYRNFNKIADHWIKFQGTFFEDIKEGDGKILLANGETLQGLFSKGLVNGEGVFTNINQQKIFGKWVDNILSQ